MSSDLTVPIARPPVVVPVHKPQPVPLPKQQQHDDGDDAAEAAMDAGKATVASDRVLSTSANLAQLLPTGSVLAYQSLSASFTNQGECYASNWWLSLALVTCLTASCVFFAFTDCVVHRGKVYYGVATPGRLNVFNLSRKEEAEVFEGLQPELRRRGLKKLDWVHAFFTAVVFLTVAASDVGLQKCFFPDAGPDTKELLKNMPLGMAVLSSFVFMIFPTTRRGIGSQMPGSEDSTNGAAASPPASKSGGDIESQTPAAASSWR